MKHINQIEENSEVCDELDGDGIEFAMSFMQATMTLEDYYPSNLVQLRLIIKRDTERIINKYC